VLVYIFAVDLRKRVLMLADDDGRRIDINQEYILGDIAEDVFLCGYVEGCIVTFTDDE
jgi:hypothetical protein